jgi:3-oxoacid CoA-transferase subunit B
LIASKYKSAYIAAKHGAFHLLECAPGVTIDEIKAKTAGNLVISDKFKTMSFE